MSNSFNYDYIIKTLVKENGWGNTISDSMTDFESSDYFIDVNTNDEYIIKFNEYLMKLGHNKENRENLILAEPISWYSKLT